MRLDGCGQRESSLSSDGIRNRMTLPSFEVQLSEGLILIQSMLQKSFSSEMKGLDENNPSSSMHPFDIFPTRNSLWRRTDRLSFSTFKLQDDDV
jgi:hypothetical protein